MTTPPAADASQPQWRTGISELREDQPFLFGYELSAAAEADVDFSAIILLAFTGRMPSRNESRMANAMLVLAAAHGISPSGAIARILAASGVPIQVSTAGAMLSIADFHGGAGEQLARSMQNDVAGHAGDPPRERAERLVDAFLAADGRVPGFGHPMHGSGDPRGPALLDMAVRLDVAHEHCRLVSEIGAALADRKGRHIPINLNGACAGILSDLGVPWSFMRVFNATSRLPVLGALAAEESQRERRWRMTAAGDDVVYDGPAARPLPEQWQSGQERS